MLIGTLLSGLPFHPTSAAMFIFLLWKVMTLSQLMKSSKISHPVKLPVEWSLFKSECGDYLPYLRASCNVANAGNEWRVLLGVCFSTSE
jgi:hypothetical protein